MCRLIVVTLVFIFSNAQEYFNITRQPSTLSHTDVPDVFRIPTSLCGESTKGGEECPPMGGRKIGDCQCNCNTTRSIDNRRVAYKSTFGFYGGKWKCVNNSLLWNQTGCLRMTEDIYDPIKTLSRTVMKTTSSNSSDSLTRLIVNSSTCTIERLIADNSSYLDCEGRWKSFNGTNRFRRTKYGVEFNLESDRLEPRLEGLIIRLGVKCFSSPSVSCLLLKLNGHQICRPSLLFTISPVSASPTSVSSSSLQHTEASKRTSAIANSNTSRNVTAHTGWLIAGSASAIVFIIMVAAFGVIMYYVDVQKEKQSEKERKKSTNCSEDSIPVADHVNQRSPECNFHDQLEYEIMPNTETDESKGIKQEEETSETLDSAMYSFLVGNEPHVYGSLKGLYKRHEDETDRQVMCTSQNMENSTYQQLDTFGQQNHGEYQPLNYKKETPPNKIGNTTM